MMKISTLLLTFITIFSINTAFSSQNLGECSQLVLAKASEAFAEGKPLNQDEQAVVTHWQAGPQNTIIQQVLLHQSITEEAEEWLSILEPAEIFTKADALHAINVLDKLIASAEPLKEDLIVWRGSQPLNESRHPGFLSTSLSSDEASKYVEQEPNRQLYAIRIPRGSKVLNLTSEKGVGLEGFQGMQEVVLPRGTRFIDETAAVNDNKISVKVAIFPETILPLPSAVIDTLTSR